MEVDTDSTISIESSITMNQLERKGDEIMSTFTFSAQSSGIYKCRKKKMWRNVAWKYKRSCPQENVGVMSF